MMSSRAGGPAARNGQTATGKRSDTTGGSAQHPTGTKAAAGKTLKGKAEAGSEPQTKSTATKAAVKTPKTVGMKTAAEKPQPKTQPAKSGVVNGQKGMTKVKVVKTASTTGNADAVTSQSGHSNSSSSKVGVTSKINRLATGGKTTAKTSSSGSSMTPALASGVVTKSERASPVVRQGPAATGGSKATQLGEKATRGNSAKEVKGVAVRKVSTASQKGNKSTAKTGEAKTAAVIGARKVAEQKRPSADRSPKGGPRRAATKTGVGERTEGRTSGTGEEEPSSDETMTYEETTSLAMVRTAVKTSDALRTRVSVICHPHVIETSHWAGVIAVSLRRHTGQVSLLCH